MSLKRDYRSFDFVLLILVFIMCIFGIIVIGSATRINMADTIDTSYESQQIWFVLGIILMLVAAFIDYNFICKFYVLIYIINIALLIIVFIMPPIVGVSRWISIAGVQVQPSEFAKIFMVLFVSKMIDRYNHKINNIGLLSALILLIIIPTILIFLQPSLAVSIVIPVVCITIIFIGNISYKYILSALAITLPVVIFLFVDIQRETPLLVDKFLREYHINRLIASIEVATSNSDLTSLSSDMRQLLDQQIKSIQAIGSGMFDGKGLYNGEFNQLNYVAHSHNDFIFAVIGEEFGFVGCVFVLALQLLIIFKCFFIGYHSPTLLGKLIASGIGAMIAFQSFINVGVSTGILPNTGMPFPFISYGGSALWVSMIGIGLVLNIGMTKSKSMFEG